MRRRISANDFILLLFGFDFDPSFTAWMVFPTTGYRRAPALITTL